MQTIYEDVAGDEPVIVPIDSAIGGGQPRATPENRAGVGRQRGLTEIQPGQLQGLVGDLLRA